MGEDEFMLILIGKGGVTAEVYCLFGQNIGLYAQISLPQPRVEAEISNTVLIIISLYLFNGKFKNRVVVAIWSLRFIQKLLIKKYGVQVSFIDTACLSIKIENYLYFCCKFGCGSVVYITGSC